MAYSDKAYNEYEKKLYSIPDDYLFTKEKVDELFDELLSVLPNGGKLYKYKALKTFHVDELEKKYVWFSAAKNLNDRKDCTFNANMLKEQEKLVKFLCEGNNYQRFIACEAYLNLCRNHHNITLDIIETCLRGLYEKNPMHWSVYFKSFCLQYQLTAIEVENFRKSAHFFGCGNDENEIRNSLPNLTEQLQEVRDSMQILSLTTSYDKDSLWAYYCNNEGICIEYDYHKVQSYELKKIFMQTQKVRYGKKKPFRQLDIMKAKMEGTRESIAKADEMILSQMLTKEKSWRAEEEWRIIRSMRDNYVGVQQPADIISAIYIDYSILNKRKTRQIICLAKQNKWDVYIRYFDELNAEYRYDTLNNIVALKNTI